MLIAGIRRGFHSRPNPNGRLSWNKYTKATMTRPNTPIQTPIRLRRSTDATSPITATAAKKMFQNGGRWKNMSQYDVNEPLPGSPWYFMSVMYWWLSTNGTTQNDASSVIVPIVVQMYRQRARSR